MKKTLVAVLIIMMMLTLFMTSALAVKPEDKPDKHTTEDASGDEEPSKQELKAAFREAVATLLDEVHANREEWGELGDQQEPLSASIEAKIAAIEANGYVLSEEALAAVKANCEGIKELQAQARGLKREIQDLWKAYINAKKESDVESGVAALSSMIEKQEVRLEVRRQLIAILSEVDLALDDAGAPAGDEGDEGSEV